MCQGGAPNVRLCATGSGASCQPREVLGGVLEAGKHHATMYGMAEESPEVRAVVLQWAEAQRGKDRAALQEMYSGSEVTTFIGSALEEWWVGRDVAAVVGKHVAEFEGFLVSNEVERVEAYREGNFGWAASLSRVVFRDGQVHWFRDTYVLRLEHGTWRIVQSHSSVGTPNREVVGVELTATLKDLLAGLGAEAKGGVRPPVAEGTVTLLFTDIEGSSALAHEMGNQRWAAVLEWHDTTIRDIVEGHGGVVVKTLGDGAMIAFEAVQPAARAAVRVQLAMAGRAEEPPLRLRIGIHTGDVVYTDTDYVGHVVNKAARITAAADGGEIMASSVVRALLAESPEFSFGNVTDVELKGLEGTHEVTQLLAVR